MGSTNSTPPLPQNAQLDSQLPTSTIPSSENNNTCGLCAGGSVTAGTINVKICNCGTKHKPTHSQAETSFCWINESPTQFFSGRKEMLERIHEAFTRCSNKTDWRERVVVLYGLGGIGKSEIARMYAQKYRNDPIIQNIAWFNAANETTLAKSFKVFAEDILRLDIKTQSGVADKVYNCVLRNTQHRLFIFDDAIQMQSGNGNRNTSSGIFKFLPTNFHELHCSKHLPLILITSRTNNWEFSQENILYIGELSEEESVKFMVQPLKQKVHRALSNNELQLVEYLAEMAQGYPLALSLAVTRIGMHLTRYSDNADLAERIHAYIKIITCQSGCWVETEHSNFENGAYDLTMKAIMEKTVQQIKATENGNFAIKVLNLMAYLNPRPITRHGITQICYFLSSLGSRSVNTGLSILGENALVAFKNEEDPHRWINIHGLVQRFIRESIVRKNHFLELLSIDRFYPPAFLLQPNDLHHRQ